MIPVILTPENSRAVVMDDEGRPCVSIQWDEDQVPLDADTLIILDADLTDWIRRQIMDREAGA